MTTSSYLFTSKRKEKLIAMEMERRSFTDSNISMDSLEDGFSRKASIKDSNSDDNVETILVPFYEKDVLIKVPKDQIRRNKLERAADRSKKDVSQNASSYLVNKDLQKIKRTTYLEMFRKQFTQSRSEKKPVESEIRSISPEVGDTERDSFEEEINNPAEEFYNTESYNEIYYEKLLHQQLAEYLEDSSEEGLHFNEDIGDKTPNDNLRSVSEVSAPRRRRATVLPIDNVKLGGLGPDVELIKPRLERARSLQRYSEKVRMENRLRIYKKSVQEEAKEKQEREALKKDSARKIKEHQNEENASYLVKKPLDDKNSKLVKQIYNTKSKSAKSKKSNVRKEEQVKSQSACRRNESAIDKKQYLTRDKRPRIGEAGVNDETVNVTVRSSARSRTIHTEIKPAGSEVPPVHISFLVNLGGVPPSSALRSLEEKHRHYQEQVKAYMDNND